MLKPFLLLTAVVLMMLTPALAPARPPLQSASSHQTKSSAKAAQSHAQAEAESKDQAEKQSMTQAKKLYEMDCALCHGSSGNGKTDVAKDMQLVLDDWTDPKVLASKTDQQLFDVIRKGKDKMPPEGEGRAKDNDVKNIIAYIRSLSKTQPAAPPAEAAPTAPSAASEPTTPPATTEPQAPPATTEPQALNQ